VIGKRGWWLAAFSCGALHAPAAAQQPAALTVLVRVCDERDRAALERVRGQTSDLAVSLLAREDGPLEPSFERQLERAEQLAAEQRAHAVVWFAQRSAGQRAEPADWLVYVATPADGRVLAHRLEPDALAAGREQAAREANASGLLEQSALIVRFALQGLIENGDLATGQKARPAAERAPSPARAGSEAAAAAPTRSEANGAAATAVPPAEVEAPDESLAAIERDAPRGGPSAWWLALGYELAADGFAPAGQDALWARASVALGRWEPGLVVSAGLPAERAAEPAGMRLQRVRFAAALAGRVPLAARWSLAAGAQAGALLQRRETIGTGAGATARAARWNAALVLGPEAAVHWRSPGWGLVLGAALDFLPSPTRFALRAGEDEIDAMQPARVQPRVFLAAELAP
jgi:hypothetical protein